MPALPPGSTAPDFQLSDAAGNRQSLAAALEKGSVVLAFFKIACPTCQYALPFLNRLAERMDPGSATIWAVSQDSSPDTKSFNERFGVSMTNLFDSPEDQYPVSNAYGLTNVPTTFLIRPGGKIAVTSVGWDKGDLDQIAAELDGSAAGSPQSLFQPGEDVVAYRPG